MRCAHGGGTRRFNGKGEPTGHAEFYLTPENRYLSSVEFYRKIRNVCVIHVMLFLWRSLRNLSTESSFYRTFYVLYQGRSTLNDEACSDSYLLPVCNQNEQNCS